ncbi:MAG: efflux RND transporter periplasmic adaptor subunit [Phycisphaerae bacterium]
MIANGKPGARGVRAVLGLLALIGGAAAFFGAGYLVRWGCAPAGPAVGPAPAAGGAPSQTGREAPAEEATVWTCSMHPQVRSEEPGRCPICGMELVPVAKGAGKGGLRRFATSEAGKALMDIETSPVERRFVEAEVRMVGKIEYDETRLAYITAWVPGRLDRLFVDYTGVSVRKGDHLVSLYSPELLSAQEELLQALEAVKNLERSDVGIMRETARATVEAAREKLRLWGLTNEQVEAIEARGTPSDHMTIYAPIGGIVVHKNALEGMYVDTGTRIYTIADLSQVWIKLDAYESDLSWLKYGQPIEFTTVAFPGETFTGTIAFIDPVLNEKTRTVKVRVNAPNPEGKLRPGMFVRAVARAKVAEGGRVMDPDLAGKWICPMHPDVVKEEAGSCDICGMPLVRTESLGYVPVDPAKREAPLVIPATAPLLTGTRAVVYRVVPDTEKPTYEGLEIVLGPRAGDWYIVRSGLTEGDLVVTNGNFKIDSQLQIQARPSMMTPEGGGAGAGHAHGAAESKKGPGRPAVEVPGAVREQFVRILRIAKEVRAAVEGDDLGAARKAFAELGEALQAVDMKALAGHAHMLWMELAMLLENDAVEGREAPTLDDARRVAETLTEHVRRFSAGFGLRGESRAAVPEPLPAAVRSALAGVYTAYLDVQEALAQDEKEPAVAGAETLASAVKAVPAEPLPQADRDVWTAHRADLDKAVSEMRRAQNIEAVRQAFALVSESLAAVAGRFGSPMDGPLYRLHCPMAFSNRGADWLQTDREVRNPYFGSAMPKCGEVQAAFEPVTTAAEGGHAHD